MLFIPDCSPEIAPLSSSSLYAQQPFPANAQRFLLKSDSQTRRKMAGRSLRSGQLSHECAPARILLVNILPTSLGHADVATQGN